MSSNYCNVVISKKIIKLKYTNCNQSQSSTPQYTKIIGDPKLADSIYIVVEQLKLFCKGKTKPTKYAVK